MLVDFKNTLNINKKAYANETCEIKAINTENIKYIDEAAFYKANIKSLKNLPELCKIGKEAFSFSQIKNFDFKNVQTIERNAFANTCLKDANMPKLETIEKCAFLNSVITSFTAPHLAKVPHAVFMSCKKLKHIEIPNCKEIGSYAFTNCINLKKITLPKTLEKLDDGVFCRCKKLEEVTFLSDIVVPYSIFEDCQSLKKIYVSENFIKLNKYFTELYKDKIVTNSLDMILTQAKSFKEINDICKKYNSEMKDR